MSTPKTQLQAEHLTIGYGDKIVQQDLSFSLMAGEMVCMLGPNGCGKSTLLNALDVSLNLETGDISKKLGRGRHTTRETALYTLPHGGRIADTEAYEKYIQEVKSRKFEPDSWD